MRHFLTKNQLFFCSIINKMLSSRTTVISPTTSSAAQFTNKRKSSLNNNNNNNNSRRSKLQISAISAADVTGPVKETLGDLQSVEVRVILGIIFGPIQLLYF